MALTALQIYKHLPKTNCGDCSSPTCLAFAMQLAGKKASLDACPHVSDEGKAALGAASAPPIRLVTIGTGDEKIELGNETVLFRHDETFYHPTAVAVKVSSSLDDAAVKKRVEEISRLDFERVGQRIRVGLVAVEDSGSGAGEFARAVKAAAGASSLPLLLMSEDPEAVKAALPACKDARPLICGANAENLSLMAAVAKEAGCPLVVRGKGLDELAELTQKAVAAGVEDIILDPGSRELAAVLQDLTQIRRQALKRNFRPLGYPAIAFTASEDPYQQAAEASSCVAKYAGVVVIDMVEPWAVLPILTLRQNIYADPQKPIQVEAKLYEVGTPGDESPVLITTNFSLTYFTVEGDVEASKTPSYIVVVDTEGTSVLTAWAAEKLTAENIAAKVKELGVGEKVKHRKIIIPGFVAVLSGKLEEELSGWEILVGPRESSGIPAYMKSEWKP